MDKWENAGFTTGEPWIGVNPDYIHCNAAEEALSHDSVLNFYRRLIALRKTNAPLIYGNFVRVNAGRDYFCYRRTIGKESFYIEINLTGKRKNAPLRWRRWSFWFRITLRVQNSCAPMRRMSIALQFNNWRDSRIPEALASGILLCIFSGSRQMTGKLF